MATKTKATSLTQASKQQTSQQQTNQQVASAQSSPGSVTNTAVDQGPTLMCQVLCGITDIANPSAYQSCYNNCTSTGIPALGITGSGANSTGGALNWQDLLIRGSLILAGAILVMIGIVKMFSGNRGSVSVTLQRPAIHRPMNEPTPAPTVTKREVQVYSRVPQRASRGVKFGSASP